MRPSSNAELLNTDIMGKQLTRLLVVPLASRTSSVCFFLLPFVLPSGLSAPSLTFVCAHQEKCFQDDASSEARSLDQGYVKNSRIRTLDILINRLMGKVTILPSTTLSQDP